MGITQPLPLLGGLRPQQFMATHRQKKPLLVRQASKIPPKMLANARLLPAQDVRKSSAETFQLLTSWAEVGWLMIAGCRRPHATYKDVAPT